MNLLSIFKSKKQQTQNEPPKTQKQAVLSHLQTCKNITPLEAMELYGVMRLSSIIHNLRGDGYLIKTHDVTIKNRYGNRTSFARYTLV